MTACAMYLLHSSQASFLVFMVWFYLYLFSTCCSGHRPRSSPVHSGGTHVLSLAFGLSPGYPPLLGGRLHPLFSCLHPIHLGHLSPASSSSRQSFLPLLSHPCCRGRGCLCASPASRISLWQTFIPLSGCCSLPSSFLSKLSPS